MYGMIGGIEYHDKKAVMKEIHAYMRGASELLLGGGFKLNIPNAAISYEGIVVSAGES
jgi:hypothetical protein